MSTMTVAEAVGAFASQRHTPLSVLSRLRSDRRNVRHALMWYLRDDAPSAVVLAHQRDQMLARIRVHKTHSVGGITLAGVLSLDRTRLDDCERFQVVARLDALELLHPERFLELLGPRMGVFTMEQHREMRSHLSTYALSQVMGLPKSYVALGRRQHDRVRDHVAQMNREDAVLLGWEHHQAWQATPSLRLVERREPS